MFTTFPDLFNKIYGWDSGISGLAYLGASFGFAVATLAGVPILSRIYNTVCQKRTYILYELLYSLIK